LRAKIGWLLRRLLAFLLALMNIIPQVTVIINPLLFIMFLPVGLYAILSWHWIALKDIPDPFHPGESLYWLTYAIKVDKENPLFPSLFRWGIIDSLLLITGSAIFLAAFISWLINLRRDRELLTCGIYGFVRHPQYLGIILLSLGVTIRSLRPISFIAWMTLLFGYLVLASLEERNLIRVYGQRYEEYARRVPFIIPYLKFNVPGCLSPGKPYRYIIFGFAWIILIIAIMVGMRDMVFALRGITY